MQKFPEQLKSLFAGSIGTPRRSFFFRIWKFDGFKGLRGVGGFPAGVRTEIW